MMKIRLFFFVMCVLAASTLLGENTVYSSSQQSDSFNDVWISANRMNAVMRNNGVWFYDYATGDWGLEWPKDSHLSPIFAAGQWISAKISGSIRVATVMNNKSEFQPGEILSPGTATDPLNSDYRWYVIKSGGVGDWGNWPVNQGAPVDANGQPLLIGDLTAFCVYNDLAEHEIFTSAPLNVEVRQLACQFDRTDALGDMIFFKWLITNKSETAWDSTFFSIWLDGDIGNSVDDMAGCDPNLGLAFNYNANIEDQNYGTAPPAVGIDFLQGPLVPAPGQSVDLPGGTTAHDVKMLSMNSFIDYTSDDETPNGWPKTPSDVWNYQRGHYRDNSVILDHPNQPTPFMFYGDPETGQGWLDASARDKRFLATCGPFAMPAWSDLNENNLPDFGEPGVQEIVAVVMAARGDNNLNSVTKLKEIDEFAAQEYPRIFPATHVQQKPTEPAASLVSVRVYPNPTSNLSSSAGGVYFESLPANSTVSIFDVAGRYVRKLSMTGAQSVFWDLTNTSGLPVAGGIYIYLIDAPGIGVKSGKVAIFTYK